MKKNTIGNTGVSVTATALGCSSIGNHRGVLSDQESELLLQYAWCAGIRYFDTAPHYGRGLSEQRLGNFLRKKIREDYVTSSKVGRLLSPGPELQEADGYLQPLPNAVQYDYSGDGIEAAFEQSCERLGSARIDIIYVHDIGRVTHSDADNSRHLQDLFDTGFDRLQTLKSAGRIGAFGVGVNENQVCLDIMKEVQLDVILLAGRLTLLDRSAEEELVPQCLQTGTELVLGGIFNSGILARGPVPGATFDYAPASTQIMTQTRKLQEKALQAGLPLASAALLFAAKHRAVCSVLIGTGNTSSLQRNLDTLAMSIPATAQRLFD